MKPLVIDCETTSNHDGHPFDPLNKLLFIGLFNGVEHHLLNVEFAELRPYGDILKRAQEVIDSHDLLILFNAKFDLHWLRRYGIKTKHKKIWDLQYAEFCLSGQTWKMPDCDTSCKNRGLVGKHPFDFTVSHTEQAWKTYLTQDLSCEYELFQVQTELLKTAPLLKKLIWNGCQDIAITQEMEWNGLKYDFEKSLEMGDAILRDIELVNGALYSLFPTPHVNWGSPEHVSAILYGGKVSYEEAEPFIFTYKNGKTKEKLKKTEKFLEFERVVEPIKGSGLKKDGLFSTEEGYLRKLKCYGKAKEIVGLLLKSREYNKRVSTYFHGIPAMAEKYGWDGVIHGQLNHCVAATGRLSSSKPNQQNLEQGVRECLVTRFLKS